MSHLVQHFKQHKLQHALQHEMCITETAHSYMAHEDRSNLVKARFAGESGAVRQVPELMAAARWTSENGPAPRGRDADYPQDDEECTVAQESHLGGDGSPRRLYGLEMVLRGRP